MKKVIECPYCDGQAHLQKQSRELTYRKEVFGIHAHFYQCAKCNEEFTTTETDTISIFQAQNQYRERYSIPFPEEVIAIRAKYDLSATKMSEVLGLGVNGYGNYEKGEIPTPAHGNLVSMANNAEVFKGMLEKAKHYFSNSGYDNAMKTVVFLVEKQNIAQPFYSKLNQYNEPVSLTGFKRPNKDKIANVLIFFINGSNKDFNDKLKLNKLLFYIDFVNYKLFGFSITGLSYRAIDYGPVPTFYDNIYTYFENEGIISSKWIKDAVGAAKETFETQAAFDAKLFTPEELIVIEGIRETFKNTSSWDLVDLSHKERGWIELHPNREIINYQHYAFDIVGA